MSKEEGAAKPRARKRVRDKAGKIERIYKSFFDLVGKMGYSKVSTNHVAAAAGISVGTVYRYFPQGKVSIIQAYFDSTQEEIFDIEAIESRELLDLEGFFRRYLTGFVRVHRENKVYHQAYDQAMMENPDVLACYTRKVERFIGVIAEKLQQLHPSFKQMPVVLMERRLLLIFNVFEALTRQHLMIMPLFPTDGEYIEFLVGLLGFFSNQPEGPSRGQAGM
ncbi:MAG: TetR/AcrR family transcriptional regulator [Candidatus Lokiarchaeota archaeon]|nr:TetR/AcrR family transcriptional regulator [Candidatus Lokiarchaeota archaeon]